MNIFNSVKYQRPGSNRFDLSHDVKMSFDCGELIPTCNIECIPGDKFNIGCESLIRFAPLVSPVMHRFNVYMHYFFVPYRILWPNWENFITNTPLAGGLLPASPTVMTGQTSWSRLQDYLGIPDGQAATYKTPISALHFAAYQRIWMEYYRDQNVIPATNIDLIDGPQGTNEQTWLNTLRKRAWEHDYFTSCLPWAQKGNQVTLPIGTVTLDPNWDNPHTPTNPTFRRSSPLSSVSPGFIKQIVSTEAGIVTDTYPDGNNLLAYDPNGSLNVAPTSINDLRRAFKLQEWLEKAARGGSRLVENIFAHFGVKSQDARFQRPEYITGTKSPVIISEVLNSTGTPSTPQGGMSGHAISVNDHGGKHFYVPEHGVIMGIMSLMPKSAYYQGIPKHFLKVNDPFAHFWPSFANIGEQAVDMAELYAFPPTLAEQKEVFGYVPRYAEYKYTASRVAGEFRTSLDFWHAARKFGNKPLLNQAFIECDKAAVSRIFAVQNGAQSIYAHVLHKISARRLMPKYGNPTF